MRAYTMALWIFVFNMALALVTQLQVFSVLGGGAPVTFLYDQDLISAAGNFTSVSPDGLETINMLAMLVTFVQIIVNSTVLIPFMLSSLGVPTVIIPIISLPCYYAYLAAVVQLVTGRIMPLFE
jgi:hypothetical protein